MVSGVVLYRYVIRGCEMTVGELIGRLQCFDENLYVEVEAEYDCGHGIAGDTVNSVEYKRGNCVLHSDE